MFQIDHLLVHFKFDACLEMHHPTQYVYFAILPRIMFFIMYKKRLLSLQIFHVFFQSDQKHEVTERTANLKEN